MRTNSKNLDKSVIDDFGQEWNEFDQSKIEYTELRKLFNQYFDIFPKKILNKKVTGFDLGCGSGRWAKFIAPKVKKLNCIDPSKLAISVAKKNLKKFKNISFYNSKIKKNLLKDNSQDFGYCLGVLHHTSETTKGLNFCYRVLKNNSPFLIYLYYNFDNRSFLYKLIWKTSDFLRIFISGLPFFLKKVVTDLIALLVYWPLARFSLILEFCGVSSYNFPLSFYKSESLYTMRTDSLDRFGTKLEKRFSKQEITELLRSAGFSDIKFSKKMPFWVAICKKK